MLQYEIWLRNWIEHNVLGMLSEASGTPYYVSSGSGSSVNSGENENEPLATIAQALDKCTASAGNTIHVMEGHSLDLASGETLDLDVAGVSIEGRGTGSLKPRIDINATNAYVNISADNIRLKNIAIRPSVAGITKGISIATDVTGTVIEDCESMVGEAGDGTDEFASAIYLTSGNNDTVIRNNVIRTHASCDGANHGVYIVAAASRVHVETNTFVGKFGVAAVKDGAACTDLHVINNRMKVEDGQPGVELTATTTGIIAGNLVESTGIAPDSAIVAADCAWFENYCVATDGEAGILIGDPSDAASNYLGTDDADNDVSTSSVVANRDGSLLERSEFLMQKSGDKIYAVSSVTSSGIPSNTQTAPITGAASGTLLLREIWALTDSTGLAGSATNIEFSVDNDDGAYTGQDSPLAVEALAGLGASKSWRASVDATSFAPTLLQSGKKAYIHGDDDVGTGVGVATVVCEFDAVTDGATIAGADVS